MNPKSAPTPEMPEAAANPAGAHTPSELSDELTALFTQARAWAEQDPDPETERELTDLIARAEEGDASAADELASRFAGRLQFGTAGLRGELGAGPMRMNRVLVAQAARGFGAFLLERAAASAPASAAAGASASTPTAARQPHVVIGYDGRKNSERFAKDTAEVLTGMGVRASLLPRLLPTPVLAFAVRHLDADGGVMVTASHNPPRDNGYKVYLGGADHGSQIVAPADREIAAHIAQAATVAVDRYERSRDYVKLDDGVVDAYVAETAKQATHPDAGLRVVYTAMHGVGFETLARVFKAAGLPHPAVVEAQNAPDPAFPTVSFPNPEEDGALDLAVLKAREVEADLIIANDPDADRVAIVVPERPGVAGDGTGWHRLHGNDIGRLLGERAARQHATRATAAATASAGAGAAPASPDSGAEDAKPTLANSLVSSPALKSVAERYGLGYAETLTGFKNISRAPGLVFGFEEALGYLVDPEKVRDKDGISAAVAVLDRFNELHAEGRDYWAWNDAFGDEHGAFASSQVSLRVSDLGDIPRIMASIRQAPPSEIGGIAVASFRDLAEEGLGDILRFDLDGGARVLVRPSGTEPKVKVYLDAVSKAATPAERDAATAATIAALREGVRVLLTA